MSPTPVDSGTRTAAVMVVAGIVEEVSSKLRVETSVGCRAKLFPLEIDVIVELELVLVEEEDETEDEVETGMNEEMDNETDEETEDEDDEIEDEDDEIGDEDDEIEDEDDEIEELGISLSLIHLPVTSLMLEKVYEEPMV